MFLLIFAIEKEWVLLNIIYVGVFPLHTITINKGERTMTPKKIAVLGGGNGAHTMAAEFALKGHTVNLFEMPRFKNNMKKVFETKTIKLQGNIPELQGPVELNMVTDNIAEAVEGCRYICIVAPAFAHSGYAKLLKGHLHKDQIVITFPGAFSALVLKKELEGDDCPIFADANNLPYDARLTAPGSDTVNVFGRNPINIAFLPANKGSELIDEMREDLFPFEKIYTDVLECGLAIVNPDWHAGPVLFNISRIESPQVNFFLYEHGWTPSACRLNIAMDKERKAIGEVLGYNLRPMEDFAGRPADYEWTWQDLYKEGHGSIGLTPICGPNDINSRYLTEDIPFGLVPWAAIAELLGVQMPLTNGFIDIINVVHEKDWRKEGRSLEDLGITGMDKDTLLNYVRTGKR